MAASSRYYAVIMAGGVGSRFWPVSTPEFPKQFHDLMDTGSSLLQHTFDRLARFIPRDNILVLTNSSYVDQVHEQIPDLSASQVIPEPVMRNTAPCILLAALKIQKTDPDAVMLVAPSDHWIEDEDAFARDVTSCFELSATRPALCTLGIVPNAPRTGFGYIECETDSSAVDNGFMPVRQFREKPDEETARSFLEQDNFYWNAGIFIWSVKTIIQAFRDNQPEMFALFSKGSTVFNTEQEADFIMANYEHAVNISIDYAILEKARSIYVLPAGFDWNDLGTWGSLYEKKKEQEGANVILGGRMNSNTAQGNMIRLPQGKIAVIEGLNDFIIVDNDDILLILPRSQEQDIKDIASRVQGNP